MNDDVRRAINEQINREFYAAYLYLGMAAHFEAEALEGFARWMRLQAKEEQGHAMRLFDYLLNRGARVELGAIEAPPPSFGSPLSIAEQALEHERKVSEQINRIYALAAECGDFATQVQLQWFLTEQVEEENTGERMVERLRMAGDNRAALLILDREVAARSSAE
ncbi:MAG TPA: ferritin [Longimicrobiaceae bacterium]|nr:ferritin [Longimicrobiaceae bacterium]